MQWQQRKMRQGGVLNKKNRSGNIDILPVAIPRNTATMGGFIKKVQQNILENQWQVIQVS